MSRPDDVRRQALEQRIRLARQDIDDLQQQVDDGEMDEATAVELEARYRQDLEAAREELNSLPKPAKQPWPKPPRFQVDHKEHQARSRSF